jgi:hypothetical protein
MHPNEQLREHLTAEERAALRNVLDGDGRSLAGPAAAGATALAGIGTTAADPSTTDSDGDVGLPGDRTDVWADGIDVTTTENSGRYNDGVNDLGSLAADASTALDPDDGNAVIGTIDGDGSARNTHTIELPSFSTTRSGYAYTFLFELLTGENILTFGNPNGSIEFDTFNEAENTTFLYRAITYDSGATWHVNTLGSV